MEYRRPGAYLSVEPSNGGVALPVFEGENAMERQAFSDAPRLTAAEADFFNLPRYPMLSMIDEARGERDVGGCGGQRLLGE